MAEPQQPRVPQLNGAPPTQKAGDKQLVGLDPAMIQYIKDMVGKSVSIPKQSTLEKQSLAKTSMSYK